MQRKQTDICMYKRDRYVSRQDESNKAIFIVGHIFVYIQFIESHMRLDSKGN